jgi:hypothetical protein
MINFEFEKYHFEVKKNTKFVTFIFKKKARNLIFGLNEFNEL